METVDKVSNSSNLKLSSASKINRAVQKF